MAGFKVTTEGQGASGGAAEARRAG
jgi:hypothetical protein